VEGIDFNRGGMAVIFEGSQGVGKSTLAPVLGGERCAVTGLMKGDKDSF